MNMPADPRPLSPEALAKARAIDLGGCACDPEISGVCDAHQDIALALDDEWAEEAERCARIVEAEEELPGPIPQDVLVALLRDPEEGARAIVRITKKSVARAIRAGAALTEGR